MKPCNSPDNIHVLVPFPQALGCMHLPFGMSSRQVLHVSIYIYFEASPLYFQVLYNKKNKFTNDSPAKPLKSTTHACFFCLFVLFVFVWFGFSFFVFLFVPLSDSLSLYVFFFFRGVMFSFYSVLHNPTIC